jgi:hypothetical protein
MHPEIHPPLYVEAYRRIGIAITHYEDLMRQISLFDHSPLKRAPLGRTRRSAPKHNAEAIAAHRLGLVSFDCLLADPIALVEHLMTNGVESVAGARAIKSANALQKANIPCR